MIFRRTIPKIFLFLMSILLIGFSILVFKIYNYSEIDKTQKASAMVVLGASQWSGNPSPVFKSRLDHAFDLYKDKYASTVILTGGIGKGETVSESLVGKNYLMKKGIEENSIFIEEQGHTSWQSLNQVIQILKEQNLDSVIILISDGFHMMRLRKMTEDLGLKIFVSPVKNSLIKNNKLTEFKYTLREAVVYIGYLLFKI